MLPAQPLCRRVCVLIADSSPFSSQLLAEAIARDSEIEVLGFSSDPVEVTRIAATTTPDILLLSARMEEDANCGLSLLQELRRERPVMKAVVLLDSNKPELVVRAFRSGASGVFCRSRELQLLLRCVKAVHNGQIWANSEELRFVFAALADALPFQFDSKRLTLLSTRERDVVRCLVGGLTNREIAETLVISQHTVKNYIFKIFDKLGVSNRVELAFQVLTGAVPRHACKLRTSEVARGDLNSPPERAFTTPIFRTPELIYRDEVYIPTVARQKEGVASQRPSAVLPTPTGIKAVG